MTIRRPAPTRLAVLWTLVLAVLPMVGVRVCLADGEVGLGHATEVAEAPSCPCDHAPEPEEEPLDHGPCTDLELEGWTAVEPRAGGLDGIAEEQLQDLDLAAPMPPGAATPDAAIESRAGPRIASAPPPGARALRELRVVRLLL